MKRVRYGILVAQVMVVSACVLGGATENSERVPLELEFPRPFFVGTPVPVKLPHLEAPRDGKRPDFLVPAGVTNLGRGAAVTSSDAHPIFGELAYVTDGDKSGGDGTIVELAPELQWVQIDLGRSARLFAIVCWHFHSEPRAYHDVIVQVSGDPEFKEDVRTLFNNDHDNSAGLGRGSDPAYIGTFEGRLIDAKGEKARYLRLYSNGSTADELNHYTEVEVYGLPEG
ncbi:MAG TPA: hypothetical protein VIK52_13610 [Opitutaceae bacterium]